MTSIGIVAEQSEWLVVDKPAGLSVHSEQGPGLVAQLEQARGESLWLVHRLDRDTSGLLLLARTQVAAASLSALFATRQVSKFYLGVCTRRPQKKTGLVAGDMLRSRDGNWKLVRSQDRPALTAFTSAAAGEGRRALLMRPHTGRTHQLRVAMKALGAPLLGDSRYGGEHAGRLHLHAWALSFLWQGERVQYQAPLPAVECFADPVMQAQASRWWPPESVTLPAPSATQLARAGAQAWDESETGSESAGQ